MSERLFDPTRTSSTAEFALGQVMIDHAGIEYVYVRANGAVAKNYCVQIPYNYDCPECTHANTSLGDRAGFAIGTAIADNDYGWVAVKGNFPIQVLASAAANTQLYTSATAGALDDTSTSQSQINGVVLDAARGGTAGTQNAIVVYPVFQA